MTNLHCRGTRSYTTHKEAANALVGIVCKGLTVVHCSHCGKHHIAEIK